ncbi:MAG: VanW family protein [Patescibacteria group bacterium]
MKIFNAIGSFFKKIGLWFAKHSKKFAIGFGVIVVCALTAGSSLLAYAKVFENRIYPHVTVGDVSVGSMTKLEAQDYLNKIYRDMLEAGLTVVGPDGTNEKINLRMSGSTDPDLIRDLVSFNANTAVEKAFSAGRDANFSRHLLVGSSVIATGVSIDPEITIDTATIQQEIERLFGDQETPGMVTDFQVVFEGDEIVVSAKEGTIGEELTLDSAMQTLQTDMKDFSLEKLTLSLEKTQNPVSVAEAETLLDTAKAIVETAPYTLTYTSQEQKNFAWDISQEQIANWIVPAKNLEEELIVSLDASAIAAFFSEIHGDIDVAPRDAKFTMENGRVTEFVSSLEGIALNETATQEALLGILGSAELSTPIIVKSVPPEITTGSTNNLGIQEILGVGTSDYGGSPSNRIANIKHGASKLDGLLVAPGETISLIEHLRPFTVADGYLPELVIKGTEIKPEIGGGLCQIGTTAFRAVMNSGLRVDERTNHSLVISYYNDPTNGKPGTDATLYDPAPDLKFTNDTANYILLTTEVNTSNQIIYFTFWGTSDGRKGYYSAPQVLQWTGYGEAQRIETTDLAPGVERCQSPHAGATTSFDYFVEYADGTQFSKNYTSVYRSLPKICMVGKGTDTLATAETTPVAEETPLEVTDVPADATPTE